MKFLIITIASLAFANAGHLHTYKLHDSHDLLSTNSISSYSSHQSFPGASTYQSYETIGLPIPSYTPRFSALSTPISTQAISYPISYVPRQHLTYNPQFAAYPIHNQPALISQAPSFIPQYPSFIQQQPSFINQIPTNPGLFPQNPIPSEPQQVSNIPQGAQVDSDTVSVEASRSSNDGRRQQINNEDDDSVTIEAAGRSSAEFRSSNNSTEAIFPTAENSASTSTTTTESSVQARNSQQQQSVQERLQYLNEARRNLPSNSNIISRSFFGNPSVFARFDLQ
ncbi:uncharacterized protein LOC123299992 [Chrysoperla carnea]|uniref:uncharacterized protein LOC123299992 n=1 Tax=Chrysoperla carnea TaxID=189513 RepID=UPI001D07B3C1|nr:uncharacterized protein LOC123299992 [Chrysoperla carnea]